MLLIICSFSMCTVRLHNLFLQFVNHPLQHNFSLPESKIKLLKFKLQSNPRYLHNFQVQFDFQVLLSSFQKPAIRVKFKYYFHFNEIYATYIVSNSCLFAFSKYSVFNSLVKDETSSTVIKFVNNSYLPHSQHLFENHLLQHNFCMPKDESE